MNSHFRSVMDHGSRIQVQIRRLGLLFLDVLSCREMSRVCSSHCTGTCRSVRPSASRDRMSRRARPHHALCSAHAALGTCTRFFSTLISSATATLAWITQRFHTCLVICSRLRPPGPMTTQRLSQSTSRTSYQPALQRRSTPGTADLPAPQRSHRTRHHPLHPRA